MDRIETLKIMSILKASYPKFYDGMSIPDLEGIASIWQEMFDEPYQIVAAAVKALITSDTKGFPPVIGQVKDKIRLLTTPNEMSELEAWELVSKALRNSTYGSAEEFKKLPAVIQRLVRSPEQLKEWAQMEASEVQTVVASNFQRSYKVRAKSEREYLALPEDVKKMLGQAADSMAMPELLSPEEHKRKMLEMVRSYEPSKEV